ncbi:MAG: hypothetical protein M3437_01735 [Chloroflexota bacterium]|nr:hypothetical protein [Chloroflexota bacterium]MDQ5865166.1 hypothetical protein [Chloroflexota bacterium]
MAADTEAEVIRLLVQAGYWDNPALWRYYGDNENNFSTFNNQQSRSDAAIVEKTVNAVDAMLMSACQRAGIRPDGPEAPQSIQAAVARFFEQGVNPNSARAGLISEWVHSKRTEIAKSITLAATGAKPGTGRPCFTIADAGEGQTPDRMPETLLSLPEPGKSNKQRVHFVQGKFNMGSTGALPFCGKHNIQLIITRRHPQLLGPKAKPSDGLWSFTIVRREDPAGGRRTSVFSYLAPLGAARTPRKGGVLRFSAASMPLFPDGEEPYKRETEWGTLIKLYEYDSRGFSSNILRSDGLLGRLDLLLPKVALPIRCYECRGYGGKPGSYETNLTGITVRLHDENSNLEFTPTSGIMSVSGNEMLTTVYAFKSGKAKTYRKNEGIIFTLNGQTHGYFTTDFFKRKNAGKLNLIAEDILVLVDCSNFGDRAVEELFMGSRDRLRQGELRADIEEALENLLRDHSGLKALRERRIREEMESKLEDSKPLRETLETLLRKTPTLATLLLPGTHISMPFKSIRARTEEKPFVGKQRPTYFKFKGHNYGEKLLRDCPINQRCRILFETDVVDDYFTRAVDRGEFTLYRVVGDARNPVESNHSFRLENGTATLSIQLPDNTWEGDVLEYMAVISDETLSEDFENPFAIAVKNAATPGTSNPNPDGKAHTSKPSGDGAGESKDVPGGISLPLIEYITEDEWAAQDPKFDQYTAMRIKDLGISAEGGKATAVPDIYKFLVNADNVYLLSELKSSSQTAELTKARYVFAQVLVGLALIRQDVQDRNSRKRQAGDEDEASESNRMSIEKQVEQVSKAIAPFVLPVMQTLGSLDVDDVPSITSSGEAT